MKSTPTRSKPYKETSYSTLKFDYKTMDEHWQYHAFPSGWQ
jgi:hypothetical protein